MPADYVHAESSYLIVVHAKTFEEAHPRFATIGVSIVIATYVFLLVFEIRRQHADSRREQST
jgi:hypothetical protein